MIEKIQAPIQASRMSDFMSELPNGILNKFLTGTGGTYLAITSKHPYIIASPTIELIQNKCDQHKEILGLWGSFTFSELQYYLKNLSENTTPKIMVTYNGLPKLIKYLSTICNPYEDYKLLVDEYHELLCQYSYRNKAIDGLITESLKFKDKCYLSATPIHPSYAPPQLNHLPEYEIVWNFDKKVIPTRIKTNKPYMAAVNIIKQYKAGNYSLEVNMEDGRSVKSYEAYFFINSVRAIKDIIDNAGLTEKEIKIICSENDKNISTLDGFKISKVSDPNKPFTFVTSKSFVGTDFYSETGMIYVVSNVSNTNTLLDVSTEIFQISGRIRNDNNPFKSNIVHIYNTGASDLTKEEFEESVKQKTIKTNGQIALFHKITEEEKNNIIDRFKKDESFDYTYYNPETDTLEFNELKLLNEKFEYEIVRLTYTNGITLRESYNNEKFDLKHTQDFDLISEKFITNLTSIQYKEILKEYCELIDLRNSNCEDVSYDRIAYLENLDKTIKNTIEVLGTGKIRTLKYSKVQINKELITESVDIQQRINEKLDRVFSKNIVYKSSDVKIKIQEVYDNLNLSKKATATDLGRYYKIDKKNRNIGGKTCDSIVIL